MGLSVIRFTTAEQDGPCWGMLRGDQVYRLPWQDEQLSGIMENLVARRAEADSAAEDTGLTLDDVRLFSPLTPDCTLLCQGLNYASHQEEAGMTQAEIRPEDNLLFVKSSASLSGPHDEIVRPAECELLDYEAELGLVMGRAIDGPVTVAKEALGDYVAG
ncbi:MAG: fumarylacetoacetate hydrolase family protein, partial [Halioglobus sp.]